MDVSFSIAKVLLTDLLSQVAQPTQGETFRTTRFKNFYPRQETYTSTQNELVTVETPEMDSFKSIRKINFWYA